MSDTTPDELRVVFGEYPHDVARFSMGSPRGEFSLEFTFSQEEPAWNVANHPPEKPRDVLPVMQEGYGYILLRSRAQTPEQAADEHRLLRREIGGPHNWLESKRTFRGFTSLSSALAYRFRQLKARVLGGAEA